MTAPLTKMCRKEAARYLTALGYKITPKTLANLAATNGNHGSYGPTFTRTGWRSVVYDRADLDIWAKERMVTITAAPYVPNMSQRGRGRVPA